MLCPLSGVVVTVDGGECWLWVVVVNVRGKGLRTHRCRSTTMVAVASSLLKEGAVMVAVVVDAGAVVMEDGVCS